MGMTTQARGGNPAIIRAVHIDVINFRGKSEVSHDSSYPFIIFLQYTTVFVFCQGHFKILLDRIIPYGSMEKLCKLGRGLTLRKCPHDLRNDRLGGHIVCLGQLVLLLYA